MAGALVNQTWNPEFYNRIHDMTAQELAKWLSWISPVGGLAGSLISSFACSFLQKLTKRGYGIVIFISTVFLVPTPFLTLLVEDKVLSLLFLLPAAFVRNLSFHFSHFLVRFHDINSNEFSFN